MDWRQIEVSDNNSFTINGELLFGEVYDEVLKFHSPGIAPVKDKTGWYHINTKGGLNHREANYNTLKKSYQYNRRSNSQRS